MIVLSPLDVPILQLDEENEKKTKIEEFVSKLIISDASVEKIKQLFLIELNHGLSAEPGKKTALLMGNSYVPKLLDGSENGDFMALDLGGTNFRVLLLKLRDGKIFDEIIEYYCVPKSKRLGPVEGLFDFLAFCIYDFITRRKIPKKDIKLGFTFSFPMTQEALDIGILVSWTKSFKCSDAIGRDVVRLLNEAIERIGELSITVNAVLNDTTGTLVKGSYLDKRCGLGIILGTGNNACYIEKVDNLKTINKTINKETFGDSVIVNLEWGAFGDDGCLSFVKTEWDQQVDNQSLFTGKYTFEKYIGGKFLGELARECLYSLSCEGLFDGGALECLKEEGTLTTTHLSLIEQDTFEGTTYRSLEVFEEVIGVEATDQDVRILQYVAGLFSYRAVQLVSSLTSVILEHMKRDHCTIAVDGSLYEHHPRFEPLLNHLISKYAPNNPFEVRLARDGSGKGAALVAAIAHKVNG